MLSALLTLMVSSNLAIHQSYLIIVSIRLYNFRVFLSSNTTDLTCRILCHYQVPISFLSHPAMQRFSGSDWQTCSCGRTFDQPSAYSKHNRTCSKTKKRLSSALQQAREKWTGSSAKRRRIDTVAEPSVSHEPSMAGLSRIPDPVEVGDNAFVLLKLTYLD
jgi:hypothetical protein